MLSQEKLEKVGQSFQVAVQFHPSHPRPNIINTSFYGAVGILFTILNHYFGTIQIYFLATQTNTKIGDTAPLRQRVYDKLQEFVPKIIKCGLLEADQSISVEGFFSIGIHRSCQTMDYGGLGKAIIK